VRELCASPAPRRSDAGDIRLTGRDVAGLLLCGEMYGAPYDLLDALPLLGDILTTAPARLQQQLYQAFDLQILYDSGKHQVSIHAVITPSTPRTLAAILSDSEPPATPSAASHFVLATRATTIPHDHSSTR
jgi:hypothetical protein